MEEPQGSLKQKVATRQLTASMLPTGSPLVSAAPVSNPILLMPQNPDARPAVLPNGRKMLQPVSRLGRLPTSVDTETPARATAQQSHSTPEVSPFMANQRASINALHARDDDVTMDQMDHGRATPAKRDRYTRYTDPTVSPFIENQRATHNALHARDNDVTMDQMDYGRATPAKRARTEAYVPTVSPFIANQGAATNALHARDPDETTNQTANGRATPAKPPPKMGIGRQAATQSSALPLEVYPREGRGASDAPEGYEFALVKKEPVDDDMPMSHFEQPHYGPNSGPSATTRPPIGPPANHQPARAPGTAPPEPLKAQSEVNIFELCDPDGSKLKTFSNDTIRKMNDLQWNVDRTLLGLHKRYPQMWSELPPEIRNMYPGEIAKRFKTAQKKVEAMRDVSESKALQGQQGGKGKRKAEATSPTSTSAPVPAPAPRPVQAQPAPVASRKLLLALEDLDVANTDKAQMVKKLLDKANETLMQIPGINVELTFGAKDTIYLATTNVL
jgi:hypothetical protein